MPGALLRAQFPDERSPLSLRERSSSARVGDPADEFEPEPWGEDAKLVEVLGEQGAAGFRALLDGFPEAVGVLWAVRADDGRIVDFTFGYGNPTMLRAFRIPAETPERYTLLEALPGMRGSRAFDAYVDVCDTGTSWVTEVTYDTPFGDGYMVGTFLHRAAKLGDGLVVFLHDVTEKRRTEDELKEYADVVAHDLSEPLSGIAMLVTLLELHPEEPPAPHVLEALRASAERARELVDGVLAYARSGELSWARVSLEAVAAEVADDLRVSLEEAGARLVVRPLPEVPGDPRQLRRVFQNLVANALRFRGDEPPRIEISAAEGRSEWVVNVRDNGIGVDREHARRIFAMFSRVDRRGEGSGIGLAVCRRVVEAHGGRIWVEAAEGGGSTFRFTLPFRGGSKATV
jgi:signal transduction histidine kinase